MQNFDKKVKHLSSLYINKFKVPDYQNNELKIYFISADNRHIYMLIDGQADQNKMHHCEVGELYLDTVHNRPFEDTAYETFTITATEYQKYKRISERIPKWINYKIKEITDAYDLKDLVF